MSIDIAAVKGWMASHVFVSMAIAVLLTILVVLVTQGTLRRPYLRLFQLATLAIVGISVEVLLAANGNIHLVASGVALMLAAALSYYSGQRLTSEGEHKAALESLARAQAELKQLKDNPAIRVVVDPAARSSKA